MIKECFLFIICIIIISCSYFDSGGKVSEEVIIGDFKIATIVQDKIRHDLVVSYSENDTSILEEDCLEIIYDSIHQIIYTKKRLNEYNFSYKSFFIKDSNPKDLWEGYTEKKMTKESFLKKKLECTSCILKEFHNVKN